MLGRIRGLLAKAESTEFPEEAEALTAKAQELMTRHAVDVAPCWTPEHGARSPTRFVPAGCTCDKPYPEAKVRLVTVGGRANGVRSVWHDEVGMATIVGLPVDLGLRRAALHVPAGPGDAGR